MKDILDIISNYNMDICEFFNQYNKRKKDNTLYSKAIKDLIYMTVDQEQYEVEVEVSE